MSKITFSISELIESAWYRFQNRPLFWVCIALLSISISSLGDYGLQFDSETFDPSFNPLGLIMGILSLYISASITLMSVKYMRGEEVNFDDITAIGFNKFIHYVIAVIISTILMLLGFLCFILPGFYIMARLIFVQYLVLDKDLSFGDAINQSFQISKDDALTLIGFMFAMFFIILIGLLCLVLGLLVAIPVSWLATAQLYLNYSKNINLSIE